MSKHKKQTDVARYKNRMPVKKKLSVSNDYNFSICYIELCRQQKIRPLPIICVSLPNTLEFTPDRLKIDEWGPILTSLSLDKVLRSIKIHSRYQHRKPLEDVSSEVKARKIEKTPLFLTRYILESLSHSVAQCVRNSSNLTCLELEGIPLTLDCVAVLCVGISISQTLQYLSLCKSYIGDSGCELICQTINSTRCLRSLNLSQCNLSSACGKALATALSRQKLTLYHDTWKQSLRYRQPNLESMPGLRRLTLNGNPRIGNSAVIQIIDAVRDSLWMKALDFQNCGLTNGSANDILDLVDRSATLIIVDVRLNSNLDERIVREIMNKLSENNELLNSASNSEFQWTSLSNKRINSAPSTRHSGKNFPVKKGNISRTTSAMVQNTWKQSPRLNNWPSKRPQTPVVVAEHLPNMESQFSDYESEAKTDPKVSLHIDLQAQMVSKSEVASTIDFDDSRGDLESGMSNNESVEESMEETMRNDPDALRDKLNRLDDLLNEERLRRKLAEEKFYSMKRSVMELENALKKKEQEMKGYVLVSQESLDEICGSFDQMLSILNDVSQRQKIPKDPDLETNVENIQEQFSTLIRRTKSDGAKRGQSKDTPKTPKKLVKSETDFKSLGPTTINIPLRLDHNIGDSPDALLSSAESSAADSGRRKLSTIMNRSRKAFKKALNSDDFNYNELAY